MKPSQALLKLAVAGMALATAQAATYTNLATDPTGGSNWNTAAYWNSNPDPVTSDNDYRVNPNASRLSNSNPYQSFTINVGGTSSTFSNYGWVRDFGTTAPVGGETSTFQGRKLILSENTAFRSYARIATSHGNWEMESGSLMVLQATAAGTNATWTGAISTSGATAIGLHTNNATILTVDTSIAGTGTLNLFMHGGAAANLNLNGDISGFTGTLFLSGTTGTNTNTRTFSIANSAISATLQLNWTSTAFRYDLADNHITFADLTLTDSEGINNTLAPGTYDADALNGLTATGIFSGTGSIKVIPEPGTTALAAVAALAAFTRRRRPVA